MLLVHWFNQLNSQSEWIISLVWSAADSTRPIGQKVANKGRLVPIIRDKLQQLTTNAHWWPWCKPVTDTGVYCIIYKQITIETIHIVKPECYSVDQHTPPSCHRVDSLMLPLRKKKKKKILITVTAHIFARVLHVAWTLPQNVILGVKLKLSFSIVQSPPSCSVVTCCGWTKWHCTDV